MMQMQQPSPSGQAQARFPSFAVLHEKLMTTHPANDIFNPRNAGRWYLVCLQGIRDDKQNRTKLALSKLEKMAYSGQKSLRKYAEAWLNETLDRLEAACTYNSANGNNIGARQMLDFLGELAGDRKRSEPLRYEARLRLARIFAGLCNGSMAERMISEEAEHALYRAVHNKLDMPGVSRLLVETLVSGLDNAQKFEAIDEFITKRLALIEQKGEKSTDRRNYLIACQGACNLARLLLAMGKEENPGFAAAYEQQLDHYSQTLNKLASAH
ncbi:MAG: hypothetical protein WC759_02100 [Candidatus Micrarchaeia archaeon]|jgi:hypothetical protein